MIPDLMEITVGQALVIAFVFCGILSILFDVVSLWIFNKRQKREYGKVKRWKK